MTDLNEVEKAVYLLNQHPDCVAWLDFGDKGNSCCGTFILETKKEIKEDASALASVKIVIPKGSAIHRKLAKSVAVIIGCKYVTYDWLIKIIGRIVAFGSYQEFCNIINLSIVIKAGMKQRNLTMISNVAEALV